MGNQPSFSDHVFEDIEKKYGQKGADYIAAKYQERRIYERINDEIARLNDHANLQESEDIEFLSHEKRRLQQTFNQARNQAELQKKGSIQEAEARHKLKVEDFSGYNEKRIWVQNLEKQVKNKYATERVRMEERVRDEVRKHQGKGLALNTIPEYVNYPDNYRRSIENECVKKYPERTRQIDATELEKKLTWQNYKQNFINILNRGQVKNEVDNGCENIRKGLIGSAPVCC